MKSKDIIVGETYEVTGSGYGAKAALVRIIATGIGQPTGSRKDGVIVEVLERESPYMHGLRSVWWDAKAQVAYSKHSSWGTGRIKPKAAVEADMASSRDVSRPLTQAQWDATHNAADARNAATAALSEAVERLMAAIIDVYKMPERSIKTSRGRFTMTRHADVKLAVLIEAGILPKQPPFVLAADTTTMRVDLVQLGMWERFALPYEAAQEVIEAEAVYNDATLALKNATDAARAEAS